MPTCIMLGTFTDEGIENSEEAPEHFEKVDELKESLGDELKGIYFTLGQYDFVAFPFRLIRGRYIRIRRHERRDRDGQDPRPERGRISFPDVKREVLDILEETSSRPSSAQ